MKLNCRLSSERVACTWVSRGACGEKVPGSDMSTAPAAYVADAIPFVWAGEDVSWDGKVECLDILRLTTNSTWPVARRATGDGIPATQRTGKYPIRR